MKIEFKDVFSKKVYPFECVEMTHSNSILQLKSNESIEALACRILFKEGADINKCLDSAIINRNHRFSILIIKEKVLKPFDAESIISAYLLAGQYLFYDLFKPLFLTFYSKNLIIRENETLLTLILHNAITFGFTATHKHLIEHLLLYIKNLPLNTPNANGDTPLIIITQSLAATYPIFNHSRQSYHNSSQKRELIYDISLKLLKSKANPYLENKYGMTALMYLLDTSNPRYLEIFLKNGVDINHANSSGITLLMHAARTQNLFMASFLLENGANIYAEDHFGLTAMDYAAEKGYYSIVELFHNHMVALLHLNKHHHEAKVILNFPIPFEAFGTFDLTLIAKQMTIDLSHLYENKDIDVLPEILESNDKRVRTDKLLLTLPSESQSYLLLFPLIIDSEYLAHQLLKGMGHEKFIEGIRVLSQLGYQITQFVNMILEVNIPFRNPTSFENITKFSTETPKKDTDLYVLIELWNAIFSNEMQKATPNLSLFQLVDDYGQKHSHEQVKIGLIQYIKNVEEKSIRNIIRLSENSSKSEKENEINFYDNLLQMNQLIVEKLLGKNNVFRGNTILIENIDQDLCLSILKDLANVVLSRRCEIGYITEVEALYKILNKDEKIFSLPYRVNQIFTQFREAIFNKILAVQTYEDGYIVLNHQRPHVRAQMLKLVGKEWAIPCHQFYEKYLDDKYFLKNLNKFRLQKDFDAEYNVFSVLGRMKRALNCNLESFPNQPLKKETDFKYNEILYMLNSHGEYWKKEEFEQLAFELTHGEQIQKVMACVKQDYNSEVEINNKINEYIDFNYGIKLDSFEKNKIKNQLEAIRKYRFLNEVAYTRRGQISVAVIVDLLIQYEVLRLK